VLRRLARSVPLYAGGSGATVAVADDAGAVVLEADPLAGAGRVAARARS